MKATKTDAIEYIYNTWNDQEDWSDLQVIYNAAIMGCPDSFEYMSDYIVSTGCINSKECCEDSKQIEKLIEQGAKRFHKFNKKRKQKVFDRIFDQVIFVNCTDCNHVSFIYDGNETIYPETIKQCWQCNSKNITVETYKGGTK